MHGYQSRRRKCTPRNATGFQGIATLDIAQNSTGNAILIGGAGSNSLTNKGTGFNILIGGAGQSTMTGNGNDILISGTTSYEANVTALDAILGLWSGPGSYVTRINKISILGVSGFKLNKTTVHSNGKANTLTDSGTQTIHQNWFLYFGATDNPPVGPGEQQTNLS
jgi:Ca2+-binding RTX toxin-like protein